jgi:hypothetical protein
LRVAAVIADDGFPIDNDDMASQAQETVRLASQSAAVARRSLVTWMNGTAERATAYADEE